MHEIMSNKSACLDPAYATTRLITVDTSINVNPSSFQAEHAFSMQPKTECKREGGLRTKGYLKRSLKDKPLITVITVVFNGYKDIEETIKRVINQTYENIEYIIVDGGSTDGTIDIIMMYGGQIDYWVSEPDSGIYDAMNKGVAISSGDWVLFVNSGDYFYSSDVVSRVFVNDNAKHDLIYGDSIKLFDNFERYQEAGDISNIWKTNIFWHQCLFARRQHLIDYPFNLKYKMCADYDFSLKMVSMGKSFLKINLPICCVSAGGLSDINRVNCLMERWDIITRYVNTPSVRFFYFFELIYVVIAGFAKKILPKFIVDFILQIKSAHS